MINLVSLLTSDAAELALSALLQPPWGLYLDGAPVIQPASILGNVIAEELAPIQAIASLVGFPNIVPVTASTVEFEFSQDFPLSNYPQELGAFQSYNKVTMPFDVKLKFAAGGSTSLRQGFVNTCLAIANSMSKFDVVTPETIFTSVNCTHIDFHRSAKRGNTLIQIDLFFQQINEISATQFSNTLSPTASGQQSIGNVQAQNPQQNLESAFQSLGAF